MVNKHLVRIYFPNEIKKDEVIEQTNCLNNLENLKFVRFVNDLKNDIKDEVTKGYDGSTRELNVEHVTAYLNVEKNREGQTKIWVTDNDHRLNGVDHEAMYSKAYEILLRKNLAPKLMVALNEYFTIFNNDVSHIPVLEAHGWSFDAKTNCWSNPRLEHVQIQQPEVCKMVKQEIIDEFDKEMKDLDL